MTPTIVEITPGIRRFSDPALQATVDRLIAELPDDSRAVTVDIGVDEKGIQAAGVVKLKKGWSVQGIFDYRYKGEWSGHAQVRWSGR